MTIKKRLEELEKRRVQEQGEIALTIVYDDGTRGQCYVVGVKGIRPVDVSPHTQQHKAAKDDHKK